jgi:hypothetical protein
MAGELDAAAVAAVWPKCARQTSSSPRIDLAVSVAVGGESGTVSSKRVAPDRVIGCLVTEKRSIYDALFGQSDCRVSEPAQR